MTRDPIELVRSAQRDAPGALDALCDVYLPVVLAWCERLADPGVNAEDAAHDVFEVMLDGLGGLREPGAFPAWLYGITRRVLAAHRRRAWLRRWLPGGSTERADPRPDPVSAAERSETARRVRAAMATLSLPHREVLVLCDLEERSDSEVAAMLGIPKNTVKSRLRRAREHVRALVGDLADDDALDVAADEGA